MPLKLYKMDISPPVCAAMMICDIHNVSVEKIDVNFLKSEQLNPDYVKKNPVHTVPVLEDDDLIIHDRQQIVLQNCVPRYKYWRPKVQAMIVPRDKYPKVRLSGRNRLPSDNIAFVHNIILFSMDNYRLHQYLNSRCSDLQSLITEYGPSSDKGQIRAYSATLSYCSHVILTYITEKYGKDESLYPKDLKKRAQVDQKLFLDTLIFFRLRAITTPAFFEGVRKPTEKQLKDLEEAYTFLEAFLSKTKFVAGDNMTIADISLITTASAMQSIIPLDRTKYPKVDAWLTYMQNQSFYKKVIEPVAAEGKKLIKAHLDI